MDGRVNSRVVGHVSEYVDLTERLWGDGEEYRGEKVPVNVMDGWYFAGAIRLFFGFYPKIFFHYARLLHGPPFSTTLLHDCILLIHWLIDWLASASVWLFLPMFSVRLQWIIFYWHFADDFWHWRFLLYCFCCFSMTSSRVNDMTAFCQFLFFILISPWTIDCVTLTHAWVLL